MIHNILSENGPLVEHWPGFQVRPNQIQLACNIERVLQNQQSIVLEAPTGTGKTLAYLLPALSAQQRIILSVGNRTLQDHLWWGEYQKLRATVADLRSLVLLKGCDNYLCLHRLQHSIELGDPLLLASWQDIQSWQLQTDSGEIQTLPVESDVLSSLRSLLTVSADRCIGSRCAHFSKCYFQKARFKASEAQVLLINHTLLLSDNRLFEKGMGALLPKADAVIVDEAHQLPELLMRSNMEMVDGYRLMRWIKQVKRTWSQQQSLFNEIPDLLTRLNALWAQIKDQLRQKNSTEDVITVSASSFQPLFYLLDKLQPYLKSMHQAQTDVGGLLEQLDGWLIVLGKAVSNDGGVLYCDLTQPELRIFSAKLASPFKSINQQQISWVFLSATLMIENSFDYFKQVLSLPDVETYRCDDSLDYENRSLLCVPRQLPMPDDENFYPQWVEQVVAVSENIQGGMLLLFSSHQALQVSAEILVGKTPRNILIYQADSNRQALLQQFRRDTNSILLATGSFWEGIDVAGLSLSCVAIDKLPFIPPNDMLALVWKQQADEYRKNVFNDYMVPHAITRLRQGVGRLLRNFDDCGVVLLGDRRVFVKSYGMRFLASLPSMPLVESVQEIESHTQEWGISTSFNENEQA